MIAFVNTTQVANINAAFGANFSAGSVFAEDALTEVFAQCETLKVDGGLDATESLIALVAAEFDFDTRVGDYRISVRYQADEEVPWIVEGLRA